MRAGPATGRIQSACRTCSSAGAARQNFPSHVLSACRKSKHKSTVIFLVFARVLRICQNEYFVRPDRAFSLIAPTPMQQAEFLQEQNFRVSQNSGMAMRSKLIAKSWFSKHSNCKNYGLNSLYTIESRS